MGAVTFAPIINTENAYSQTPVSEEYSHTLEIPGVERDGHGPGIVLVEGMAYRMIVPQLSSDGKVEPTPPPVVELPPEPVAPEKNLGVGVEAKITGYYCADNGGYYGDGGGFCGQMASGRVVYDGAAACGYYWDLGQDIYIDSLDRTLKCEDRGNLDYTQIDVFSYYNSGLVTTHYSQVRPIE